MTEGGVGTVRGWDQSPPEAHWILGSWVSEQECQTDKGLVPTRRTSHVLSGKCSLGEWVCSVWDVSLRPVPSDPRRRPTRGPV